MRSLARKLQKKKNKSGDSLEENNKEKLRGNTSETDNKIKEEKSASPRLGIIRLDYDYTPADGDIDCPDSFDYDVYYKVVPGLTFEVCKEGKMTEEVENRFKESIKWLVEEKKVNAITGDCGFMINFQGIARQVTKIPVSMSSLCQLPTVTCSYAENEQIIILTANGKDLRHMKNVISVECGVDTEDLRYNIVGCEDVPYFGEAVAKGEKVKVKDAQPWIIRKAFNALLKYPKSKAFLLECTELPPYANAIRFYTGLPVFDAITACHFFISASKDNTMFGLQGWQDEWDGKHEAYHYGDNLTEAEKKELVNPVHSE
ncbi:PREDICTED: dimethlysulfonioproprionate lyase 7-like [Acropora digitifera]|uniref:dimethlysulfonioproprionate lyase 7-like n=1 Tax=Acropora digitifera TaxID=70779 RepID=UPI00077A7326|nr:PREDICTED: dimethlysulfonioproprionate lyase 7-like [Acropora digitifera]